MRKEIEEIMERWLQTLDHGQTEVPPVSGDDQIVEDPQQEIEKLLENWILMLEDKYSTSQGPERKLEAQGIANQMQSWITLHCEKPTPSRHEEQQLQDYGETSQGGREHGIKEKMDGWLDQLESNISKLNTLEALHKLHS